MPPSPFKGKAGKDLLTPEERIEAFKRRSLKNRKRSNAKYHGLKLVQRPEDMSQRRRWTDEEDAQIAKLHARKVPQQEIGRILNRAQSSVHRRLVTLGWIAEAPRPCEGLQRVSGPWDEPSDLERVKRASNRKSGASGAMPDYDHKSSILLASARCPCRPAVTVVVKVKASSEIGRAMCPSCLKVGTLRRH